MIKHIKFFCIYLFTIMLFSASFGAAVANECTIDGPEDWYFGGICTNGYLTNIWYNQAEDACQQICVCNPGYYFDYEYQTCTLKCSAGQYNTSATTCVTCADTLFGCSYDSLPVNSLSSGKGCRVDNCIADTCDGMVGTCWDGGGNISNCMPGFYWDGNPDWYYSSCIPVWFTQAEYYKIGMGMCSDGLESCEDVVYRCPDYTDSQGKTVQGGLWSAYQDAGIGTDGSMIENYLGIGASITDCQVPSGEVFQDVTGQYTFVDNCNYSL